MQDTNKGILRMLPTGASDDSTYSKAFMALVTPKENHPKGTYNSLDNSKIEGSASESDASQVTETSDESLDRSKDISGLSTIEDSRELKPSNSAY
jgi:hypothetical protein